MKTNLACSCCSPEAALSRYIKKMVGCCASGCCMLMDQFAPDIALLLYGDQPTPHRRPEGAEDSTVARGCRPPAGACRAQRLLTFMHMWTIQQRSNCVWYKYSVAATLRGVIHLKTATLSPLP